MSDLLKRFAELAPREWGWRPKRGERYWIASPSAEDRAYSLPWDDSKTDHRGLVFPTEDQAVVCAKRMLERKDWVEVARGDGVEMTAPLELKPTTQYVLCEVPNE